MENKKFFKAWRVNNLHLPKSGEIRLAIRDLKIPKFKLTLNSPYPDREEEIGRQYNPIMI
jgi:hypothetical protein